MERRRRLDNVAKVLRQFGVTDPGDIADILADPPSPTIAVLEKVIHSLDLRVAPGISSELIAQSLLASIDSISSATIKWRQNFGSSPNLSAITTGRPKAGFYHRTIFSALNGIFDGILSNGKIEQETNTGIHRVDIMFDNLAESGFFADVRTRFNLVSNFIPIECKNYSDDLKTPEYDQLSGRLNDNIGRVGLLVFRKIDDKAKALAHQRAKWDKNELIILLDDNDILDMFDARFEGRPNDVDRILRNKVRQLQLNTTT